MSSKRPPFPLFRVFTSFASDINLRTQTGLPVNLPPRRLEVHNDAVTTQDIVLEDMGGDTAAFEVPADSIRVIEEVNVAGITASGTETIASVVAYWDDPGGAVNP